MIEKCRRFRVLLDLPVPVRDAVTLSGRGTMEHVLYSRLDAFFREHSLGALGFSGGADSAFLLYAALECGAAVRPYYVKTPFQPDFELSSARRLTEELRVPLTVIDLDILADPLVAGNSERRCYYCKKHLFSAVAERAFQDGFGMLMDGTNASDPVSERPGMRALVELSVRSPLRECGLTKNDVRRLSRKAGLFTWDKPSYSCLATRIQTGQMLERGVLKRVEAAETALSAMGFSNFRVRVSGRDALLQFPEKQLEQAFALSDTILGRLDGLFMNVELDRNARRSRE